MNPPYTSAGKKHLPERFRSKLTEIYVHEADTEIDLQDIVAQNSPKEFDETLKRQLILFYLKVR
jgi:midasin (ATPase involved in ribosome maturation)